MEAKGGDKVWNFDDWADRYDSTVADDSRGYYARYDAVLDAVVALAGLTPGQRVLDIGTGTGNLAVRCLACGAQVIGLDPSAGMLARARSKAGNNPGIEFQHCDEPFLAIPYPDSTFDAVVSTYAYHHVPHRLRAESICEMLRVLKPGGRWVVGDIVFANLAEEVKALSEHRWLEAEYFAHLDHLKTIFGGEGLVLQARQFTPVTWVLWVTKR